MHVNYEGLHSSSGDVYPAPSAPPHSCWLPPHRKATLEHETFEATLFPNPPHAHTHKHKHTATDTLSFAASTTFKSLLTLTTHNFQPRTYLAQVFRQRHGWFGLAWHGIAYRIIGLVERELDGRGQRIRQNYALPRHVSPFQFSRT